MGGIAQALTDKDFLSAQPEDQKSYLSSIDQDFAKASPEDQNGYLNHILAPGRLARAAQPTQFEKDNPVPPAHEREANEFLLGAASGASGLPESTHALSDFGKSLFAPPKMNADTVGESILGPAYGVGKSIYNAGKQIFSPSGQADDAAMERAHGVGSLTGMAIPAALGEGINRAPGEVLDMTKSAVVDATGQPKPVARLVLGGDRAKALGELVNPELGDERVALKARADALRAGQTAPGPWTPNIGKSLMAQDAAAREAVPITESPVYPKYLEDLEAKKVTARQAAKEDLLARKAVPLSESPYANRQPELGSAENPGFHAKLPARLTAAQQELLRGGVPAPATPSAPAKLARSTLFPLEGEGTTSSAHPNFNAELPPTPPEPQKPFPTVAPKPKVSMRSVAEGVKGSIAKPSGRLVLTPEEIQAEDQMQAIARDRASKHGMYYAAGMRPAGGGRVPLTPTGTTATEFPGPREAIGEPIRTQPVRSSSLNLSRSQFTEPVDPRELEELSRQFGRPITAEELLEMRRRNHAAD
jgi:hypothetical protein